MWISKIELTEFKSYQHQIFHWPSPEGKNIILIGGMNGYGKTTLLQAIYLGLYGNEAITYLARAGLMGVGSYNKFLENALHGNALQNDRKVMSILIQFHTQVNQSFQIKRTWHFSKKKQYLRHAESVEFFRLRDNKKEPLQSEDIGEILDQQFVPAHLAPFFFFDGEKINELANQNRSEQIQQGMESLLGVVLLRNLKKTLTNYQANTARQVHKIDEEKIEAQRRALTQQEEQLAKLQHEKKQLECELGRLKNERTSLTNKIASLGGENVVNLKDINNQQKILEKQRDECQRTLDYLLITEFPLQLVGQELIENYRLQISGEKKKLAWEAKNQNLKKNQDDFINRFAEIKTPKMHPELTELQKKVLKNRLEKVWQSMFAPKPKNCATDIIHHYLSEETRQRLLQRLQLIESTNYDLIKVVKQKETLDKKIEDIKKRAVKIEGIATNGKLETLKTKLHNSQKTLDEKQKLYGDNGRELTTLTSTINQLKATYEREFSRFIVAKPVLSKIAHAHNITKLIDELIPALYQLKQKHLKKAMCETYQQLSHKKNIAHIDIDDKGNIELLNREGTLLEVDRSAGEDQIFATALLAGLAKVSGLKAPLIVDTPLGRLDSTHRENILNFWISDQQRQVILLSQDKEIDVFYYNKFKNSIAKTYLLQHQELGEGIGKTVAIENSYFITDGK
ncbi:DNA sulfur modification protein DndD [Candidatus Parabeggiatoa sp. HSG14]|uniref:DNA sulfur modification protein DndD n=1 Tax=Candidatus Parabeggiatoa sp. HSG14 TaxID=3055593 RepID=UPI0025A7951E|nr:DNA sulfur modification protein DndD [Thiotrichales bacterium HSG14]